MQSVLTEFCIHHLYEEIRRCSNKGGGNQRASIYLRDYAEKTKGEAGYECALKLKFEMRAGYGRSIFGPLLPLISGCDISGEVASVGTSVRFLSVGQDVFRALHPTAMRGTYTDYAILSEDNLHQNQLPLVMWVEHKSMSSITRKLLVVVVGTALLMLLEIYYFLPYKKNAQFRNSNFMKNVK